MSHKMWSYLTHHVGRQTEQAQGVAFVPGVQHTNETGYVVSAVFCAKNVELLEEQYISLNSYQPII